MDKHTRRNNMDKLTMPIGITILTLGVDEYASNCKQAIHMPNFGLSE